MQGLAQRVTATRPDLVGSDASYGELAWNWGKDHATQGHAWRRRLWFAGDDLVAWGWARLPRQVRRRDGSVTDVTSAYLAYQVHPGHAGLVDEVIDWFDDVAPGVDRTVLPNAADEFGLRRWHAHGYETDHDSLGDWTQLNERDLTDVAEPELPTGFRFRTADEAGPEAVVQAHVDAWNGTTYSREAYEGVRQTTAYRSDLHVLVEAPDGTMACSAVMWLDEVNKTAESEPVGTHPALPAPGPRHGGAAARHAARAGGRGDARDGGVPGRGRAPGGTGAVLRRRVPAAVAGRAAAQAGSARLIAATAVTMSPGVVAA